MVIVSNLPAYMTQQAQKVDVNVVGRLCMVKGLILAAAVFYMPANICIRCSTPRR